MSIRSIRSCASTRLAAATLVVAVAWTACDMPPEPVAQPPVSGPPAQASSPAPASAVETTQQEFRLSCTVWKSGFFNPFWAAQYWIGVAAFQQLVDRKVIVDKAECDQWGEDLADVPFGADPPDSLVQCMCSELRYPAAVPSNRDPVSCAGGNGLSQDADRQGDRRQPVLDTHADRSLQRRRRTVALPFPEGTWRPAPVRLLRGLQELAFEERQARRLMRPSVTSGWPGRAGGGRRGSGALSLALVDGLKHQWLPSSR